MRRGAKFVPIGMSVEKHVTKDNKYVINQKLEHVDDISFRVVFLQNKICLFLAQGICFYVGHSFL